MEETSNKLVELLLSSNNNNNQQQIQSLVDTLVGAQVSFDPKACLDGPLYFSRVVEGPSPLWERLGLGGIQGQQYVYNDKEQSVINYAEILGNAFHVRAYGTYERDTSTSKGAQISIEKGDKNTSNNSFLNGLFSAFNTQKSSSSSSQEMLQCPADFIVTVTKGSIVLLGGTIDIPIQGTGYLRVLYANPQLRIFVSPKSTTDDRWEKAGLMVAQVCIDQKDSNFGILT
mmetsp:Transcript_5819/g.8934  ORF Transcript_5819/g.8934 Transcript_5819/m.8934 type:complete len:229 (-) Transcript_5819:122-808(-)|eukprot:CAMPEP_0178920262 /NCGR_PEP_ID=MMETSP0786-20121207/14908_1 /TAXON_ID=186022 /ORGANISM="Thalassionema frauenfeldii, Strain CCMP 1798" /LENGTH=228 /DNA_ID=CAMNT_0020594311 /DNA_START=299 /DNA_END=985 /DNA_ORIENTATION=-